MSAGTSASLYMTLLSVLLSVSAGQTNIRADPGQTVSLPCKALNNDPVIVLEWRRTDLKEDEYVLLYRDDHLDTTHQHPSYKNRVDLQDRQMKDGDVSLILNNVKIEDRGTYECRVETETSRRKRDAGPITTIKLTVVPGQTNITAEPGQTVSLPCKALNNDPVIYVDWRRADMKEDESVLLYRDDQFHPEYQHPSYQNRVDLRDRQMKDGDVSLILNNVKTEDRGTYECYINQREKDIIKKYVVPISIIRLEVAFPPGHTDERKEDGGDKEAGDKDGSVGLIVGLTVAGVLIVAIISFFTVRRMKKKPSPPSSPSSSPPLQSADESLCLQQTGN